MSEENFCPKLASMTRALRIISKTLEPAAHSGSREQVYRAAREAAKFVNWYLSIKEVRQ